MSLTKTLAKNTTAQIVGKFISTALGIAAVMMMTRGLGPTQFGWYVTAFGFLQFVGIFSDFGFTLTSANMLAEGKHDRRQLLNVLYSWRFVTAVVFNGLAPLIFLFFPYQTEIKLTVLMGALSFFAIAINQVYVGYYQAEIATYRVAWGEILGRLALVGGTALAIYNHLGFFVVMGVIVIASIVNTLYLRAHLPKISFSFDKTISRAIYSKIWPNATAVIFNSFYLQGDRVILPLFTSQATVGVYGAAYRVLDIAIQLAAIMMGIMIPLLTAAWAKNNQDEFKRYFRLSFTLVAAILIPILAGILVLAEPIMRFVAGSNFAGGGAVLAGLSWAILGFCFGMVFGHTAVAINQQRRALWIYGTDAVLSVIGYFVFIPIYGVTGAIGVTIFSEVYAGLLLMALVIRYSKVFPPMLTFGKILLASVIMATGISLLPPLPFAVSVLIGIVIYAVMAIILRIVKKETLVEIFKRPQ